MTSESPSGSNTPSAEMRVIVLPPTRADGLAMAKLFEVGEIAFALVRDISELCREVSFGAGSVIVGEEAVLTDPEQLINCVAAQPMWSDLPIIVLSRSGRESGALAPVISKLGNVSVVERPVRTSTLVSLVRSNHRARIRQYQVRTYVFEREELLASERAARSEVERASRMKDEFLATLSHELRTPLNAVLGWTQVLRKSQDLPTDAANGLRVIERNARSQAQIIEDLLDMSSIISGKVRLDVQSVDLAVIVNVTVETVRPAAQAKDIRLHVVLDPLAGPVRGDPSRLQQVLWNLLTNAVKFTPKGGRVTVTLARINSHLEIEVADSGEGIDPAFLPYVFDRFRQADASTSRRHGGLGLGLSIVKQLVEFHGGTISAKSMGLGTGATFRLTLPLMPISGDPSEVQAARKHPRGSVAPVDTQEIAEVKLTGLNVLVVDDEPDSRALIQRVLESADARVSTAASAEDGIQALLSGPVDVLVSDVGMPGEDGYSLIRRVRSLDREVATLPAIALTAYARKEDRIKAIQAGYQLHLSKPVEPVELVAMIASVVRGPGRGR